MALSIDQKGLALEFKAFGLDNNFKDLLMSGRVAYKSIDGEQGFKRINLAPGESYLHQSIGGTDHPTMLVVRAEPRAPGKGVVVAHFIFQQTETVLSNYDPASGRAGALANYGVTAPVDGNVWVEIDKLFVWTGIFRSIELHNPPTNLSSVQVAILEG